MRINYLICCTLISLTLVTKESTSASRTDFIRSLSRAYDHWHTRPHKRTLHHVGQRLALGDLTHVACIANCREVHWVAIVIDFKTQSIWHGDSLGWKLEADLRNMLEWWLSGYSSSTFAHRSLPITHHTDTHSCGLLAWNNLTHFFLPEMHPLMDPASVTTEWLHVLLCICQHQCTAGLKASNTHLQYSFPPLLSTGPTPDSDSDVEICSPEGASSCDESSLSGYSRASTNSDSDSNSNNNDPAIPEDIPMAPIREGKPKTQIQSSLRLALQSNKKSGFLAYFKPRTQEEYKNNLAWDKAKWEDENSTRAWEIKELAAKEARLAEKRELARQCQKCW
jgi:hypothetical protein